MRALDEQPRCPAVHDWPAYRKIPTATASIAFSRFASGKTMTGALPPASSETRLNVRAPSSISRRPTSLLPVKLILSTRGSVASASPITSPAPTTPLATPRGSASIRSSSPKIAIDDAGASLAGLSTNVQPVAIAAPILRSGRSTGSFQGVISAADPDRLLEDEVEQVARRRGGHLAADHPGGAGVEQDPVDGRLDLALADVADRLAHLGRDEARQRLGLLAQQPGELEQDRRPLAARGRRPGAVVEGGAGGGDRPVRVARRRTAARPRRASPVAGSRLSSVAPDAAGDQRPVDVVGHLMTGGRRSGSSGPLDGVDGQVDARRRAAARRWSAAGRA